MYWVIFASTSEIKSLLSFIRGSNDPLCPRFLLSNNVTNTVPDMVVYAPPLHPDIRRICKGPAAANFIDPPFPGADCGLPPFSPSQIRHQHFVDAILSLGSKAVMICRHFSSNELPDIPAMAKSSCGLRCKVSLSRFLGQCSSDRQFDVSGQRLYRRSASTWGSGILLTSLGLRMEQLGVHGIFLSRRTKRYPTSSQSWSASWMSARTYWPCRTETSRLEASVTIPKNRASRDYTLNARRAGRDPLRMSGALGSELGYGPSVLRTEFLKAI